MKYPSVIRLMCCCLLHPPSAPSPPSPLLCVNHASFLPDTDQNAGGGRKWRGGLDIGCWLRSIIKQRAGKKTCRPRPHVALMAPDELLLRGGGRRQRQTGRELEARRGLCPDSSPQMFVLSVECSLIGWLSVGLRSTANQQQPPGADFTPTWLKISFRYMLSLNSHSRNVFKFLSHSETVLGPSHLCHLSCSSVGSPVKTQRVCSSKGYW